MAAVQTLQAPPGKTGEAYVIPCYSGELWYIPTSNSILRMLVTGKETNDAFAVVGSGGTFDKPIGFHYHREAHDVFLCLKGIVNIWANDTARTMGPGDFASVPPGTIHQYQIASDHTEFVGLIVPGGWEEFFRFIGEPYEGALFPTDDKRNPFQVLVPKLIAATEKFDMIPVREKASYDPQPWDGTETKLPGKCENGGYFLKAGAGPKVQAAGLVVRALATRKESDSRFSIYEIQGSSVTASARKSLKFAETHHAIQTVEGVLNVSIDGKETKVGTGETVFVPAGQAFEISVSSKFARAYVFANGGGIGEVLMTTGSEFTLAAVPEAKNVAQFDVSSLSSLEKELKYSVV